MVLGSRKKANLVDRSRTDENFLYLSLIWRLKETLYDLINSTAVLFCLLTFADD